MKSWLKSPKFWVGVVGGMVAGPWAVNKVADVTGVGISLPSIGSSR